jgi:hypothetical protein
MVLRPGSPASKTMIAKTMLASSRGPTQPMNRLRPASGPVPASDIETAIMRIALRRGLAWIR